MAPAEWCAQQGVICVEYPACFAESMEWKRVVTLRSSVSCVSSVMRTSRFADRTRAGSLGSFFSWQAARAMETPNARAIAEVWRVICRDYVECYIKMMSCLLSGHRGGVRPHRGIDHGPHRGNAVRREARAPCVLADELLVFGEVHAIDLVACDEALNPLNVRAELVEGGIGLRRRGVQRVTSE